MTRGQVVGRYLSLSMIFISFILFLRTVCDCDAAEDLNFLQDQQSIYLSRINTEDGKTKTLN